MSDSENISQSAFAAVCRERDDAREEVDLRKDAIAEAANQIDRLKAEKQHWLDKARLENEQWLKGLEKIAELTRERNEALALLAQYSAEREHNAMQALAHKAEMDEAAAKLSTVYRWIERNQPDGFIDSQSHLQNLDRVADAWHDKLEAMREAIRVLTRL